jgi:hypothetical protein
MTQTVKSVNIQINVGDEILVGKFRNSRAKITKIEVASSGDVVLKTTKGERNALTYRKVSEQFESGRTNPADKYR